MSTLFVTSFSPDLYKASGKRLMASFADVHYGEATADDRLLVCTEGEIEFEYMSGCVLQHDLDTDAVLHTWLKVHADIIPDYLGGKAEKCDCPNTEKRHAKHRHGCYWQWMNRNASRWFRKVVSLHAAHPVVRVGPRVVEGKRQAYKFDYMVWLDSDTYFVKPLPQSYLAAKLDRANMFYFRGHRPGVESGILGFKLNGQTGTARLLVELLERYTSGAFRKDERWDDGYQIGRLLDVRAVRRDKPDGETDWAAIDLVHPTKWKGLTNNVIPTTDIAEYLVHRKGLHGTQMGIMQ